MSGSEQYPVRAVRLLLCTTGLLAAQTLMTPKEALERLLTASRPQKAWFGEAFLAQVPLSQIENILKGFRQQHGRFVRVTGQKNPYEVEYEKAILPAYVTLDREGRFVGLVFRPPRQKFTSWEGLRTALLTRPEVVSVLVKRGERDILVIQSDTLLAVGSAFKLAVLAALLDEIESGRRRWEEVVLLDSTWRSVPSGLLQDWHPGSPLTLHTLAALMISRSDNTATDALIHLLGRERVERYGYANRPFLTTREFFHLLYSPSARSYSERWYALSEGERRRILTEIGRQPIPRLWDIETRPDIAPGDLQATWLFSLRELDTLMHRVERLPLMSINPGLAQPEDWQRVAYKGGSFPGCLNMTTVVYSPAGERIFVGMTWNSLSPIREEEFLALYGGILRLLQQGL